MTLRVKLLRRLVRPQKNRPPHGSAPDNSTAPTQSPGAIRPPSDRTGEFFMRRGAAEQRGKLLKKRSTCDERIAMVSVAVSLIARVPKLLVTPT